MLFTPERKKLYPKMKVKMNNEKGLREKLEK